MFSSNVPPRIGATTGVAVVGVACRLPGAPDADAFWRLLDAGQSAVSDVPAGRWNRERYFHPRQSEPGFSYSFAGGYIADPLAFDPGVFGISPREAAEMDPQQRLLLEAVWSALEDAGVPPSAIAGTDVGVYVGASGLDYGNLHVADPGSIDSHFMTGNTLSILSNRISYIFDLHGPSFTIDTACSSSLVAFAQAQAAIASGQIDMAIVAGVNLLLSPLPFVGFSRASMLSPTGLCRPFSADADGYVRGEGVVALVLARLETAVSRGHRVRSVALASGINSDGRTNGIALPASEGQKCLLDRLYGEAGIDPNRLAFVEAHGTGTRVGDPAEASAIGEALGSRRDAPLPIGSVKSNIGHLEPASGLAGLFKAVLALEHRRLPASLHLAKINSSIDFARLNLALATRPVDLPASGTWLAGVSSFGFGGTNAHVVIRQAEGAETSFSHAAISTPCAEMLVLSAYSRQALRDTSAAYAAQIEAGDDLAEMAGALAWQRDFAGHRIAVPLHSATSGVLRAFAAGGTLASGADGVAPSKAPRICFVYSGNGSQWVGMGRAAYAANAAFRSRFQAVDRSFSHLAEWSLVDALHSTDNGDAARNAWLVQPLLFAVQSALTASLAASGFVPDMVLGHSVGEVAAAEASGALSLDEAVRVIFHRSSQQEAAHGLGGMAVASISREGAEALIAEGGLAGVEIAAVNSPGSVTIAGPMDVVSAFSKLARRRRIAARVLELPYPFHCSLLDKLREKLLEAFGNIGAAQGTIPFISTVTGSFMPGEDLDAGYWWRNVRQTVLFSDAVETAGRDGATVFVEIGPRPILHSSIADTLREAGLSGNVVPSLVEKEAAGDPVMMVLCRAIVLGCNHDTERLFGARPDFPVRLPPYAWQRRTYQQPNTSEAMDLYGDTPRHKLLGTRLLSGTPEWRNLIDPTLVPYLADHRIDGEIVVPASAFAEMALAVAREVFPTGPIGLEDFDLLQWLPLQADQMRELSVRLHGDTATVEIWSRPRHAVTEWVLHAKGHIVQIASPVPEFVPRADLPKQLTAEQVYRSASATGVDYGPLFQIVRGGDRSDTLIEVELAPYWAPGEGDILHPVALDAAFHAMFDNIKRRTDERYAYLPVRFAALRVERDHAAPVRARVVVDRETDQSLSVGVTLYDQEGRYVAGLTGGLFRAVVLERPDKPDAFFAQQFIRAARLETASDAFDVIGGCVEKFRGSAVPDAWLYLGAFVRSLAFRTVRDLFGSESFHPSPDGIAPASAPLLTSLITDLQRGGVATHNASGWLLEPESDLPEPADILQSFAAEYPAASAEIVLAAQALAGLKGTLQTGASATVRPATLEHFESTALLLEPLLETALSICTEHQRRIAPETLRVLVAEPYCLGILKALAPMLQTGEVVVSVLGVDDKRLNLAAARHGGGTGISFDGAGMDAVEARAPLFDVAFGLALGPTLTGDGELGRAIRSRLNPDARFCLLQPPESPIFDCLLGRASTAQQGDRMAITGSFDRVDAQALGEGLGHIIAASVASTRLPAVRTASIVVLQAWPGVAEELAAIGHVASISSSSALPEFLRSEPERAGPRPEFVFPPQETAQGGVERSAAELATILEMLHDKHCRLWVVVRGMQSSNPADIDPAAEAIWSFARVAVNEYPSIDLRLVDLALGLTAAEAAGRFAALLAHPGAETEILLDRVGTSVTRMTALPPPSIAVSSARLQLSTPGIMARFDWVETSRRPPELGEIEIEVAASGLNFRDVMLASGLLDDDVLDDGMAGAVFGFECAGRVLRIGGDVTHLQPGDAVMGFGRESFATHITADARVFVPVPGGMSTVAAATIPVAFLTAWYSLVHMAQIQPGEWVLIHGAAGGVGLAAMQIARLRGARIAATVGSPEKRAVVQAFGAERIYNSRSTAFLDEIRRDIGGVDVVLNSLAGEAMLASVKCLKPFGRLIELGKRDYVENTALGLRPFRRNLSYFGVDLDQLLAASLPLVERMLAEIATHFDSGAFSPLPYRAFDWHETGRAFQLMQSAGHVGKLVVRPADRPRATHAAPVPFRSSEGAHLVVGGAGGFGFEAASWLAERGAKTIVVASRRGVLEPQLHERANAMRAAGTTLIVEPLDVTDAAAVEALTVRLAQDYGRIAGVLHAAMVLDDGLISSMDPVRTHAVLAPKVDGANNLDRATRAAPLDYFVVFSSVATMIGNPGQGAYVAANGYLQGLVARRRAEGLAGLAVGWGAIADAGILARDPDVAGKLSRLVGIEAMQSRAALAHLETLLGNPTEYPASVYCAQLRPGVAADHLKVLRTPAFEGLFAATDAAMATETSLVGRMAGKSDGDARAMAAAVVAGEVARIFRLPPEEIEMGRPLDELGLDSMMSLDLRMSIEKRTGIELPVVAITAGVSVNDLAARLVGGVRSREQRLEEASLHLLQQHGIDEASLEANLVTLGAEKRRDETVTLL